MSLRDAVYAMRGEPGTRIHLTIQRAETAAFDVAITRDIITVRPVKWRVENDIGYLRIVSFNEKVEDEVEEAMNEIRRELGSRARGLILDLRNNPGGALDQSLAVADDFLDDGVIVSIRGRDAAKDHAFAASAGDLSHGLPMVVLINAGSASASEIVAAALQDHRRATVMGTRSFGKGSVQTVMRLPVDGALKLTTALYYGPSGETIQAAGVEPDIILDGVAENPEFKREIDLPGALPERGEHSHASRMTLDGKSCPAVGEEEDRELGCAIALLRAGSTDRFLASLGQ
jgi:carboxyl-terminal processing protease